MLGVGLGCQVVGMISQLIMSKRPDSGRHFGLNHRVRLRVAQTPLALLSGSGVDVVWTQHRR